MIVFNYLILLFCISDKILYSNGYEYVTESTLYPKVEYFHPPEGYQPVKGYEPSNYQPNRKKIGAIQEKPRQLNPNQSPNPSYFNPFNLNSQQIYQQVYNNQYSNQQTQSKQPNQPETPNQQNQSNQESQTEQTKHTPNTNPSNQPNKQIKQI